MGSRCYGEPDFGNETSSSSANHSRKGRSKSSNNSDNKPKQPRRGLGVAQLEKIRLMHSQMAVAGYLPQEYMRRQAPYSSSSSFVDLPASSSSYCFSGNPSIEMGENFGYAYSQPDDNTIRWPHGNAFQDTHQLTQPMITRQLFQQEDEDSLESRRRKVKNNSMGTSSHSYESNGNQDLDLELRLSI